MSEDLKKRKKEISKEEGYDTGAVIEGRNPVIEAFRAGKTVDKVYILDGCNDGPVRTIVREAKKRDTLIFFKSFLILLFKTLNSVNITKSFGIFFVSKERLDEMSETGHHQGVIARVASYGYANMDDIFENASQKGEEPFIFLLDGIEDPYNLGAIIRTANVCGAHGVVILKRNASGITPTTVKASAGAVEHTPVVKVTNLSRTIDELKEKGLWFVCADMDGEVMYRQDLTGPIGIVIGNEGSGVSRLVKEKCDFVASVPVKGEIESLNASVAAGVLAYEIVRQRMNK